MVKNKQINNSPRHFKRIMKHRNIKYFVHCLGNLKKAFLVQSREK